MKIVFLTALGVGGATVFGTVLGFVFKNISRRFSDIVLSLAAGVMLAAAILGLILPALDYGGHWKLPITGAGIFSGAVCINLFDRLVPWLQRLGGADMTGHPEQAVKRRKVLLFVTAIAIHNLPEGIAAGVGFGTGSNAEALTVAGGIALQNIPEGMVLVAPMLASGIPARRTFLIAAATGVLEVLGTLLGYLTVSVSAALLPFALAFAGGTMLYVIGDEMIPETHAHGMERGATYALLAGFCVMLATSVLLA